MNNNVKNILIYESPDFGKIFYFFAVVVLILFRRLNVIAETKYAQLSEEKNMPDLKEKFKKAADDIKKLSQKPSNDVLLKLYSLYKQGSDGDVSGKRPGMTDFKGRAKYDAWAKLKSTSNEKAMKDYIALVESLR